MSWFFPLTTKSASSSAAGSPDGLASHQKQKQHLIESFWNSHSSIAEIQKDVEYRLPFTINSMTIIHILLPPQFPQEKPVISVYHLMHKQEVYATLPLHYLLDEFWKNPPVLAPTSTAFPYLYSNPSGMPSYASRFPFLPPYPPQEANMSISSLSVVNTVSYLPLPVPTMDASIPTSQNGFGYKMPDVPDAFPELSELSVSQPTDMNEQEEVLLEQFLTLPQLKQIITDKGELVKSIEKLARKKSPFGAQEAKRQTVLDKKKKQKQHELSESCSASALKARLKVAAHEAQGEPDNVVDDFLEGKMEIDGFLHSFVEKRTTCHCRRAREEKLQQAIAHTQFHAAL
uniref:VPS37 C-terminal domain-containing protein n=1 Tax=Aotus nancymaae TaxID=37293 RepID=A0A2K5E3U6_AOTNA